MAAAGVLGNAAMGAGLLLAAAGAALLVVTVLTGLNVGAGRGAGTGLLCAVCAVLLRVA